MRIFFLICGTLSLTLSACAPFPQVGQAPQAAGPMPVILPLDAVLAAQPAPRLTPASDDPLQGRAARLRQKAQAMQGDINDPALRARLSAPAGLAQP